MKNKFTSFYVIFASVFYLFCIGFFAFNLCIEFKNGDNRSQSDFDNLTYFLKQDFNNISNISTETLSSYGNLSIYKNNRLIFNYSKSSNNSDSNLVKKYTKTITASEKKSDEFLYIDADVYLLKPYSIFYYARISFILVFILSFITIVLIILSPSVDKGDIKKIVDDIEKKSTEKDSEPVLLQKNLDESSENIDSITENQNEDESEDTYETEKNNDETEIDNNVIQENKIDDNIDSKIETNENLIQKNNINPEGLFSPLTSFGWESYLKDRLENEVNRAIASESDISVFVIDIPEIKRDSKEIKSICDYLSFQFQFRDLIFEYKDTGFVIILNNSTLENSLEIADKLVADIKEMFDSTVKCFIGITAKSIRIVSGDRLLKEADEALKHAHESEDSFDCPIVAFQVNSDKYLEFIENKN